MMMERIQVSPDMAIHLGAGPIEGAWPAAPIAFVFDFASTSFAYVARPDAAALDRDSTGQRLILVVSRAACAKLLGRKLALRGGERFHIPGNLRAMIYAVRDCAFPDGAQVPYRGAKAIEALCEVLRLHDEDALVPFGAGAMSMGDSQRLMAARRFIEDKWAEKITLDTIARACGLNRAKLTKGFRDLFDCSVADAIAEQRLGAAKRMLLATDLPVSSIGYRCGYLNNASFARAFSREFGVAPTRYRAERLAA